jgi:glutaredoxin 3
VPAGDITGSDIQDALLEITGGRSVPRVFVDGKFIGGGDDTAAKAANGELKTLLVAAGAMKEL